MQLKNEFVVAAGVEETWELLTDLDRIVPCMPGAALTGRDGQNHLGTVKVKVGPISAHFRGVVRFVEQDDANHKATISARGKDPKGQATAAATIRAWLQSETATSTRVFVETDLDITGRMAQFGRSAIADVSNRLIGQFTDNLSREVLGGSEPSTTFPPADDAQASTSTPFAAATAAPSGAPATDASLDVMSVLVPMVKERHGKTIVGALVGLAFGWLLWGRKTK